MPRALTSRKRRRSAPLAPYLERIEADEGFPVVAGADSRSALVWLARALSYLALTGNSPPADCEALVGGLRARLTAWFGDEAIDVFGLLLGDSRSYDSAALALPDDAASRYALEPGPHDFLAPLLCGAGSSGQRRQIGQHATPDAIAALILDLLLPPAWDGSLFDPAVGTGVFLSHAWHRMALGTRPEQVLRRLAGAELCPVAHALAMANLLIRLGLSLRSSQPRADLPAPRIRLGDAFTLMDDRESPAATFSCANPPYLGERRHKAFFHDMLARHPSLRDHAWARGDLLYWFFLLGLWSLRPGGRLGFLTPAYWLTADGAAGLRAHLLRRAKVLLLVDFADQPVFETATGEQALLSVLALQPEGTAHDEPTLMARVTRPGRLVEACEQVSRVVCEARATGAAVREGVVEAHWGSPFSGAAHGAVWFMRSRPKVEALLEAMDEAGQPLGNLLDVRQGLVTGADTLSVEAARELADAGGEAQPGEGVFVLRDEELARAGIDPAEPLLVPFFKNSDIRPHAVLEKPTRWLIYLDGSEDSAAHEAIHAHLQRFRPILERRRECQMGRMPWWRLHWPRDHAIFTDPKIVCPHRAPENRFAYVEGPFYASADVYFIRPRDATATALRYYEALLNSSVLDLWFAHRGKRKGPQREYYATPLKRMPLVPWTASGRQIELAEIAERATDGATDLLARRDALARELFAVTHADRAESAPGPCLRP